jgi:hypothetical protein
MMVWRDPPYSFEGFEMKIHLMPPLPYLPPAAPQKASPTTFEIEQMTEELVETARYWRTQRANLSKVRKKLRRADEGTDSSKSKSHERLSKDKIDKLA